jgi:hypothetical protein
MNRSNWEHVGIALLLQAGIAVAAIAAQALITLVWPALWPGSAAPVGLWVGAALAIGVFLGREHAQREFDIAIVEGGRVGDLNPLAGLRGWDRDHRDDFYPAALAVLLVALAASGVSA